MLAGLGKRIVHTGHLVTRHPAHQILGLAPRPSLPGNQLCGGDHRAIQHPTAAVLVEISHAVEPQRFAQKLRWGLRLLDDPDQSVRTRNRHGA